MHEQCSYSARQQQCSSISATVVEQQGSCNVAAVDCVTCPYLAKNISQQQAVEDAYCCLSKHRASQHTFTCLKFLYDMLVVGKQKSSCI